jgi:hypothetical protein
MAANFTGSGSITLPVTLAPGTYDVYVHSSFYLKKKATVSIISNAAYTLPALPAGDLNNDGIINSLDWSLVGERWFTNYPDYDFNSDGLVNSIDFSYMNRNWGRNGDA